MYNYLMSSNNTIEQIFPDVLKILEKLISFGSSPMPNEKIAHLRLEVPKSITAIISLFSTTE